MPKKTFSVRSTHRLRRAIQANGELVGIVTALLRNANPDGEISEGGVSFLDYAATNKQAGAIAILLEFGAVADDERVRVLAQVVNQNGDSPIHEAVLHTLNKALTRLLKAKVDVDMLNLHDRWSPLMMAARVGSVETVRLLLEARADIECRTDEGVTPLFIACGALREDVVQLLLEWDASIDAAVDVGFGGVCVSLFKWVNSNTNDKIVSLINQHKAMRNAIAMKNALTCDPASPPRAPPRRVRL